MDNTHRDKEEDAGIVRNNSETTTTMNKRQRFYNLMKNTREVYIPNLKSTISQQFESATNVNDSLRNGLTSPSLSTTTSNNNNNAVTTQQLWPKDLKFQCYPTYTTWNYQIQSLQTFIRFNVYTPGNQASRKNRFILKLCGQYLKTNNNNINNSIAINNNKNNTNNEEEEDNDDLTINSQPSYTPTPQPLPLTGTITTRENNINNAPMDEVQVLQKRISGFFARRIIGIPLTIELIGNDPQRDYLKLHEITDQSGNIRQKKKLPTKFNPRNIIISIDNIPAAAPTITTTTTSKDEPLKIEYPINLIKQGGIGLISDIDDTIKHTGITGDRRSMFRNVFIHDIKSWLIDGMPLWYNTLRDIKNADFFYVSNSPLQMFPILQEFITGNYPDGPLFLKQYSGNFLASLMTSSANRKLQPITNILNDFPKKKFILVGDSGEMDFEAYISIAMTFPEQIAGIYIRCCSNSLSDSGERSHEEKVMNDINDILKENYHPKPGKTLKKDTKISESTNNNISPPRRSSPLIPPVVPSRKNIELSPKQKEMIQLSRRGPNNIITTNDNNNNNNNNNNTRPASSKLRSRPPPPPIPTPRNTSSSSEAALNVTISNTSTNGSSLSSSSSFLSSSSSIEESGYQLPSSQDDYGNFQTTTTTTATGFVDTKAENWKRRVCVGIEKLNNLHDHDTMGNNTDNFIKPKLLFFMEPGVALEVCLQGTKDIE
ncbi:phosphatidate phosphatase APP1 NDAI_0F02590 [Naumovozyma dairenensis CBS 421]|uniref:Phosphatidate phosphatase APP1 catalytic domain-containing protein n=1 Tax=Naumovozyma dairenensis (strain ATCC 10597 / BCRC 20456 / CBS 421 / NBRC 0211 / NRRL Y-12639) TaxID=1071378 RepID=G0WCR6_NAUDC|nr:hypothetical protein NDAI_0F02590 [Naumovozyma dairenensis CBS 421]CCD25577.1 hypothetical protein NDAI_0F02590 [Naumovozyma dairenensis CBS 421]